MPRSATALSLQRPSPFCHPAQPICGAPCVCPATTGPNLQQSSPNPHGNTNLHLSFRVPGVVRGTADLSASRDDKNERVVARKGRSLNGGIFKSDLSKFSRPLRDS